MTIEEVRRKMKLKRLKENIEQMGMKKCSNPTKEYKELCYIVNGYGEPYLHEITQYVWNFDGIQRYLADMAKEDGPTAMESALYLWGMGWTSDDYYYIDGNTVYPLNMDAVNRLKKRLLKEIEEGGER